VVPYQQSEILDKALIEAGVPSTLVIVKNGDHGLVGEGATPTQEEIYNTFIEFLETTLK
jgi:dipeptidyl aminopeptidase/acylaminoacyl peptidase